jgi:hypothetical protein
MNHPALRLAGLSQRSMIRAAAPRSRSPRTALSVRAVRADRVEDLVALCALTDIGGDLGEANSDGSFGPVEAVREPIDGPS